MVPTALLATRSIATRRWAPAAVQQCCAALADKHKATTTTNLPSVSGICIGASASSASPVSLAHRWQSSATTEKTPPEKAGKGIFDKLYDRYSLQQQTFKIFLAEKMLQAATHQASDPRWYLPGRLKADDFRTYQAMLTMHVWFLHRRLISNTTDPHMAMLIQEELFDILWTDTTCRMRAHGVGELLIDKNLKTVQQYTFMHCFHYDHCYKELLDKPFERYEELKHLVCRHILLATKKDDNSTSSNSNTAGRLPSSVSAGNGKTAPFITPPGVSADLIERLVWYIEAQYQNIIHDWPEEYYQDARVAWVDLPDFSGMRDATGRILPDVSVPSDQILPKPWVKNIANDGVYYYWNLETRKAQWEKPGTSATKV